MGGGGPAPVDLAIVEEFLAASQPSGSFSVITGENGGTLTMNVNVTKVVGALEGEDAIQQAAYATSETTGLGVLAETGFTISWLGKHTLANNQGYAHFYKDGDYPARTASILVIGGVFRVEVNRSGVMEGKSAAYGPTIGETYAHVVTWDPDTRTFVWWMNGQKRLEFVATAGIGSGVGFDRFQAEGAVTQWGEFLVSDKALSAGAEVRAMTNRLLAYVGRSLLERPATVIAEWDARSQPAGTLATVTDELGAYPLTGVGAAEPEGVEASGLLNMHAIRCHDDTAQNTVGPLGALAESSFTVGFVSEWSAWVAGRNYFAFRKVSAPGTHIVRLQQVAGNKFLAYADRGGSPNGATSIQAFALNTPYTIVVTWDAAAAVLDLYVDGVLDRSISMGAGIGSGTGFDEFQISGQTVDNGIITMADAVLAGTDLDDFTNYLNSWKP